MSISSPALHGSAMTTPPATPAPITQPPAPKAAPQYHQAAADGAPTSSSFGQHPTDAESLRRPCMTAAALDCVIEDTYRVKPQPGWERARARTWTCVVCGPRILPFVLLDCWFGLTYPVRACAAGVQAGRVSLPVVPVQASRSPATMPEGLLDEIEQQARV